MFKRMEIVMTENLCPADLVLVVTLQDLHTKKAYRYLSLLMGFSRLFEQLDVRVFVCSLEDEGQTWYNPCPFTFIRSREIIFRLDAYKSKTVFGRERMQVYSYLYLFEKNEKLCLLKRINYDNLVEVCQRALKKRYEIASKNLKKLVDIPEQY